MKRILIMILAIGATLPIFAQSVDWSKEEVRDPVQLRDKLNTDGAAVESRIASLEGSTNVGGAGAYASITLGTATIQTNATVGGTLAVTGVATLSAQPNFAAAALVSPTGAVKQALSVKVNGTNYVVELKLPNT